MFIRHLERITYFFQIFKLQRMLSFRHYKICGLISPLAVSDSVKLVLKICIIILSTCKNPSLLYLSVKKSKYLFMYTGKNPSILFCILKTHKYLIYLNTGEDFSSSLSHSVHLSKFKFLIQYTCQNLSFSFSTLVKI